MQPAITDTELIERLLRGEGERQLVDQIIDRAIFHARNYIHWLIWHRGYHLGPTGLSADDCAYDLLAELLSELDGEMLGRLRAAIEDVMAMPDREYDHSSAFIAVVNRTVRLHLARLFMDINPVHARLLRALRRYVTTTPELCRIDSVSGFWYARAGGEDTLHQPPPPPDLLRAAVVDGMEAGNPVRAVLHACLNALDGQTQYRRAVQEADVLEMTMTRLQLRQEDEYTIKDEDSDPGDGDRAYHVLIESVELAREWIRQSYVDRGKLSEQEAEAMLEAMRRYVDDLHRQDVLGHVSYLRQTMPGLTQQRYRQSYRNIYEYLLRTVFTNARKRLE